MENCDELQSKQTYKHSMVDTLPPSRARLPHSEQVQASPGARRRRRLRPRNRRRLGRGGLSAALCHAGVATQPAVPQQAVQKVKPQVVG